MFTENQYLAFVDSKINLSLKKLQTIELHYRKFSEAFLDRFKALDKLKNKWAVKLQDILDYDKEITVFLEKNQLLGIQFLNIKDVHYPPQLTQLSDPPIVLYCQGNIELLKFKNSLTIVGSRNFSKYSELVLKRILPTVCGQQIPIVSGLAIGIDGLAHQIAVETNCATIGVIGSGLDDNNFYPSSNLALKKKILATNGLVISQFCIGTKATPYNFPSRNRILAALSEITWVVQAGLKSGSLITATIASELGKTLATTPASVLDANFSGNIKLIKEGCQIITCSEDVFDLLGLQHLSKIDLQKEVKFNSETEKSIYENIGFEAKNVEQIAESLNIQFSVVASGLSLLEMSELVTNLGGNIWIRS